MIKCVMRNKKQVHSELLKPKTNFENQFHSLTHVHLNMYTQVFLVILKLIFDNQEYKI